MTKTNRLLSLFAAMLFSATMMAEVVYEPLIVDSGFNRDIILAQGGDTAISYLNDATYWIFATESVIADNCVEHDKYTNDTTTFNRVVRSGWPANYKEAIRCTSDGDVYNNDLYKDVFWQLAPYNEANALCIRPDKSEIGGVGKIKFKKVGSYERIFILLASAFEGSRPDKREAIARVYYTTGEMVQEVFEFSGLSGKTGHNVRLINICESGGYYMKNEDPSNLNAFAAVFHIDVEKDKLISRIEFENTKNNTSVMILGVTGATADIAAPTDASTEVNDVEKTSFQACWDKITEAVSYRIDVATDPDFQNILANYNNKEIDEGTCAEIEELVSNHDYYWRVRSVNAEGGQSASSAVRRVRTALDPEKGDTPPETSETSTDIEEMLKGYAGFRAVVPSIKIHRTLCRNGYFNTLCLPFSMNAEQIAASPIAGVRVFEFVSAEKHDGLDIVISGPIDHIDAGVPYLVNWVPTTPEWIGEDGLVFENVNITTYKGDTIGADDEVQFIGNIGIASMVELDQNNLFLGANNTLYYPENDEHETRLRGFRAYFLIPSTGAQAVARHTPARIVMHKQTPTDVEAIGEGTKGEWRKILRDGQLIILRGDKEYNAQGQRVK